MMMVMMMVMFFFFCSPECVLPRRVGDNDNGLVTVWRGEANAIGNAASHIVVASRQREKDTVIARTPTGQRAPASVKTFVGKRRPSAPQPSPSVRKARLGAEY